MDAIREKAFLSFSLYFLLPLTLNTYFFFLFQLFKNPADVYFAEGNHLSMLDAGKVGDVINETYNNLTLNVFPKMIQELDVSLERIEPVKTR